MSEWRKYLGISVFVATFFVLPAALFFGPGNFSAYGGEKPGSEFESVLQRAAGRVAAWSQALQSGRPPALPWSESKQPVWLTDNPALSLSLAEEGEREAVIAADYAAELLAAWTAHRSVKPSEASAAARAGEVPAPEAVASPGDLAGLLASVAANEPGDPAIEAALVGLANGLAAQAAGRRESAAGARPMALSEIGESYSNQNSGRLGAYGLSIYHLAPSARERRVRLDSDSETGLLAACWSAPEGDDDSAAPRFYREADAGLVVPAMAAPGYLLILNPSSARVGYDLRLTAASVEADGFPTGQISATPNPVQVCSGAAGLTTILWAAQNVTMAEVRVGAAGGKLFAQALSGSISANWITQPTLFYLVDVSEGRNVELTRILVDVSSQGCAERATGSLAASVNPVRVCQINRESTSLTWTTRDVTQAEIRVESPTGSVVARGPSGTVQIAWITRPVIFYLLDITAGRSQQLAQLLMNVTSDGCQDPPSGTLSASPDTVQYCGKDAARTTLTWSTRSARLAELRAGALTGALVATGASGTVDVPWIQGPTLFYLVDNNSGRITELARVLVETTDQGCLSSPRGQIQAAPNPAQVCGGAAGGTAITWNTTDVRAAEIRIGGAEGKVFASGLAGAARASFINQPTSFVLYDITGERKELARVLVGVSNANCPTAR